MFDYKSLAIKKTKRWIVGLTQFRNGGKFIFTFGGLTKKGEIIGLTSHSIPKKELIKIYSLSDVREWAESEEIRKDRYELALKKEFKEKIDKI